MLTRRQARKKLGTRSHRRAATNGKIIPGTGSGTNQRMQCYRYPRPSRRLGPKVAALLKAANPVQ